ncbi:MAG: LPS export ABC transporter permease LptF [Desulfobacterales bacterium]|nr:LPS export ABC transporter permease LptF [Desulfobacterales bacterium]
MRTNSIINRYIFREMIPPFVLNVIFFTFIFLLSKILEITNMIVNYKVGFFVIFQMILFFMPYFLVFVIPMSVMMSVLLTFLRLSNDNEIMALKAGGASLYNLLPPVLMFCFIGTVLTAVMSVYGLPWSKTSLRTVAVKAAASNVDIGIKARTFNDSFKGVMIYVNEIDIKSKVLKDIFIEDHREKSRAITVIAPKGRMFSDKETGLFHLRLEHGSINQVDPESRTVNAIDFETYDLNLDLQKRLNQASHEPIDESEMSLPQLRQMIQKSKIKDDRYYSALLEWHKKFSIPFACFALGILALPLGTKSKTRRQSFGIMIGIALFLLYYLLLSTGLVFGEAGVYPPIIGMWVPNIVMGTIGIYMLIRAAKDQPVDFAYLSKAFAIVTARFFKSGSGKA